MSKKIEIDIIILSYAQSIELKEVTDNCIKSLLCSEDPTKVKFNIIVVESERAMGSYQYEYTTTIYPDVEFGYNLYMNKGIDISSSPYVCICNNDLIFYEGWATNIVNACEKFKLDSASPACGIFHPQEGFKLDGSIHFGYRVRAHIAGWCLFFKRDLLKQMGRLDENYRFWCADNDYGNTLFILKLRHGLVTSSRVDHLGSITLHAQTDYKQQDLTYGELKYWEKKWKYRLGTGWEIIS